MRTKFTVILLLMVFFYPGFAQVTVDKEPIAYINKNSFHTYGSFGLILVSAGIHYERIVLRKDISVFVHGGLGTLNVWGEKGEFITIGGGMLTNSDTKHHFESSLGINYFFNKGIDTVLLPSISAGYRIQKPGKPFVFRTGVAFFQGLYIGFGYSF